MKLAVITPAHKPYSGGLMERSAARVGISVIRYGEEKEWPNDFRQAKMVEAAECIRTLPDEYTHVLFVDASDSLFLGDEQEILSHADICVTIQGEKGCYPHPGLKQFYPFNSRPWRHVNSGGWIAPRETALLALETAAALGTFCDQYCWTLAHLISTGAPGGVLWSILHGHNEELRGTLLEWSSGKIATPAVYDPIWRRNLPEIQVDSGCRIFQSMYCQEPDEFKVRGGRLHNLVTNTTPAILHWNGTQNRGTPYSRTGIWYTLDIEAKKPQLVERSA